MQPCPNQFLRRGWAKIANKETAPGAEIHYEHTRECSPEPWLERMPDDAAMIFGYVGSSEIFDDAVCEFAVEYADQTERTTEHW